MPTVAVTGAEGFLGRHLTARLQAGGVKVVPIDVAGPAPSIDIRLPIDPVELGGAETVVHLAALTGVQASIERPTAFEHTNVDGTARVMEAAVEAGARRVVLVSSSTVYGECQGPVDEGSSVRPLSPYARSKLAAEQAALSRSREVELAILRPFTVYGPFQRPDMLIARLISGDPCTLWPFVRDLTFVDEVVTGIVCALDVELETSGEVFNLGSGRPVSADSIVGAIATVMGRRPTVEWGPARPVEAHRTWADTTKARTRLGMPEPIALIEGIRQQVAAAVAAEVEVPDSPAWPPSTSSTSVSTPTASPPPPSAT